MPLWSIFPQSDAAFKCPVCAKSFPDLKARERHIYRFNCRDQSLVSDSSLSTVNVTARFKLTLLSTLPQLSLNFQHRRKSSPTFLWKCIWMILSRFRLGRNERKLGITILAGIRLKSIHVPNCILGSSPNVYWWMRTTIKTERINAYFLISCFFETWKLISGRAAFHEELLLSHSARKNLATKLSTKLKPKNKSRNTLKSQNPVLKNINLEPKLADKIQSVLNPLLLRELSIDV